VTLQSKRGEPLVPVAVIRADPGTARCAGEALRRAGIAAVIGGSRAYGIQVGAKDQVRARSVLARDAKRHRYWLKLIP